MVASPRLRISGSRFKLGRRLHCGAIPKETQADESRSTPAKRPVLSAATGIPALVYRA